MNMANYFTWKVLKKVRIVTEGRHPLPGRFRKVWLIFFSFFLLSILSLMWEKVLYLLAAVIKVFNAALNDPVKANSLPTVANVKAKLSCLPYLFLQRWRADLLDSSRFTFGCVTFMDRNIHWSAKIRSLMPSSRVDVGMAMACSLKDTVGRGLM